jgi:hypothetical protein
VIAEVSGLAANTATKRREDHQIGQGPGIVYANDMRTGLWIVDRPDRRLDEPMSAGAE